MLYTIDTTVSIVRIQGLFPGGRGQHITPSVFVTLGGCAAAERMARAERAVPAAVSFMENNERVRTLADSIRRRRLLDRVKAKDERTKA